MSFAFDASFCVRATHVLLHSLWEGVALAIAAMMALAALRVRSARIRYIVLVGAQLAMFACIPLTLLLLTDAPTAQVATVQPTAPPQGIERRTWSADSSATQFDIHTPLAPHQAEPAPRYAIYSLQFYLFGVSAMLARLCFGLYGGKRLARSSNPITEARVLVSIARAVQAMQFSYMPAVAYSNSVRVPSVVGILRPMLLLPFAIISGLSAQQIEILVMHELAHIRRCDHIVNLIQRTVECFLFYHPAAWYLSRCSRYEREICCDDMVIAAGGPPHRYAGSLLRMLELNSADPITDVSLIQLAATGNPSQVRHRILRLLHPDAHGGIRLRTAGAVIATMLFALSLLVPLSFGMRTVSSTLQHFDTLGKLRAELEAAPDSLNARVNGDRTRLHMAAGYGTAEEVLFLLQRGADPNVIQDNGLTPLHYAVATNRQDIVSILLDAKADINAKNILGRTPLHITFGMEQVVSYGMGRLDDAMTEFLLARGADPNIADRSGLTPLHVAVLAKRRSAAAALLNYRARVDVRDQNQRTPLHHAGTVANRELIQLLVDAGADARALDARGLSPLDSLAIQSRQWTDSLAEEVKSCAELLLGKSPEPDLCVSVILGLNERVRALLIEDRSRVNVVPTKTMEGFRLLHWAAATGNSQMCDLLLSYGANTDAQSTDGRTPLYIAATRTQPSISVIKSLIRAGASVDLPNRSKATPLIAAASHGDANVIHELILAGANVNAVADDGTTALYMVTSAHGRQPGQVHMDVAKALLDAKIDLDAKDLNGQTALHLAAHNLDEELITFFCANGASVNARDNAGRTPLLLALSTHKTRMSAIKLLLEKGADPSIADEAGQSALELAANTEIAKLLQTYKSRAH